MSAQCEVGAKGMVVTLDLLDTLMRRQQSSSKPPQLLASRIICCTSVDFHYDYIDLNRFILSQDDDAMFKLFKEISATELLSKYQMGMIRSLSSMFTA
jgi:hypothetical protein